MEDFLKKLKEEREALRKQQQRIANASSEMDIYEILVELDEQKNRLNDLATEQTESSYQGMIGALRQANSHVRNKAGERFLEF